MSKKKTAVNDSVKRVRELREWFMARNLDVLVAQMYKLIAEVSHDIDYVYENLEPSEWKTGFDAEKLLPWFTDQSEFSDCLKTVQRGYCPTLDDIAEYLVNIKRVVEQRRD